MGRICWRRESGKKESFCETKFSRPFHFIFAFCLLMKKAKISQKKIKKIARKLMQTFREKMQKFHEKNGNCAKKNENFAKNAEFLKQTQNSNIYWCKGREFIYMT